MDKESKKNLTSNFANLQIALEKEIVKKSKRLHDSVKMWISSAALLGGNLK